MPGSETQNSMFKKSEGFIVIRNLSTENCHLYSWDKIIRQLNPQCIIGIQEICMLRAESIVNIFLRFIGLEQSLIIKIYGSWQMGVL